MRISPNVVKSLKMDTYTDCKGFIHRSLASQAEVMIMIKCRNLRKKLLYSKT